MWDWGQGEESQANCLPLTESGLPTGRTGSHPFGASGKDVRWSEKVGAGRVRHTAKCVKDMQRFGIEWAPPTPKRERMEGTSQAAH